MLRSFFVATIATMLPLAVVMAESIPVVNGGFESPITSTFVENNAIPIYPGETFPPTGAGGWTVTTELGSPAYNSDGWLKGGVAKDAVATEGLNVGYLKSQTFSSTTGPTGKYYLMGISQEVVQSIVPSKLYTLRFDAFYRQKYGAGAVCKAMLLADGVPVAGDARLSLPYNASQAFAVTYISTAADEGKKLSIKFYMNTLNNTITTPPTVDVCQFFFDNVRLDTSDATNNIHIDKILFQKAYRSASYSDSSLNDQGGVMYIYVRNTDSISRQVSAVTINGTDIAALVTNGTVQWWRTWPEQIAPGSVAAITVKAYGAPIAAGQPVTVTVTSSSTYTATAAATLAEQKLKLGSVIPSQDMRSIYLYLRNSDTAAHTITGVYMNDDVFSQCSFISGTSIAPAAVGIIKVDFATPLDPMKFLAIRIRTDRSGATVWTGAPIRLVPAYFQTGTWSSALINDEDAQQYARSMSLNGHTGASINDVNTAPMFYKYGMKSLNTSTSTNDWIKHRGSPVVSAWMLADEPDLTGAITSAMLTATNQSCWNTDPNHPTYVNLCKNYQFGKYAPITDIVGMDHYVMYGNNILGAATHFEEIIEYTDALKFTTEPRPMWVWPQLVFNDWSQQPSAWGVNLQFWSHIMCGAKGINWYRFAPGDQDDSSKQAAVAEAVLIGQELAQIRPLLLYGEVADIVQSSSADVKSRAIVGEDAMVVVLTNYNYTRSGFITYTYSISPVSGSITVPVPIWIPIEQVKLITAGGANSQAYTLNGRNLTINFNINLRSLLFVIGKTDTQKPDVPVCTQVAQRPSANVNVLSWADSFDNHGIFNYRVFKNSAYYGQSRYPVFTDSAGTAADTYQIQAVDTSGNLSDLSKPFGLAAAYWTFARTGDFEGWSFLSSPNAKYMKVDDGTLSFNPAVASAYIYSPKLLLPAAQYRYLHIKLKNATPATQLLVSFQTSADPTWRDVPAIAITPSSDVFEEYVYDLSTYSYWTGNISSIRIAPALSQATGSVAIEYIILQDTSPQISGDADGDGHVNFVDFAKFALHYLDSYTTWSGGDFNGDNATDFNDLQLQIDNWLF